MTVRGDLYGGYGSVQDSEAGLESCHDKEFEDDGVTSLSESISERNHSPQSPNLLFSMSNRSKAHQQRSRPTFCSCQTIYLASIIGSLVFLYALIYYSTSPVGSAVHLLRYDYIVVGGGPAGIIAATQLAKRFPDLRILLLESGTVSQTKVMHSLGIEAPDSPATFQLDVPLFWSGVASSQRPYMSKTQSHPHPHWPIEKTLLARALGGCGQYNAMVYVRSLPTDFKRWNLTLWTYDDILPHYVAMERYVDTDAPDFWKKDSMMQQPWRGKNGKVTTKGAGGAGIDAIAPLFIESAINSGLPLASRGFNDPNPAARVGVGYYEFNIRHGTRDSVAQALLGRGKIPDNLHVRTGITVTRVIFNHHQVSSQPIAVGVEYAEFSGHFGFFRLNENGEVILTAGAIITPQILWNSGISEGGALVDLPGVGKNLQDHPVVAMAFNITPEITQYASTIYTMGDALEDYLRSVSELELVDQGLLNSTFTPLEILNERIGALGTAGFSAGGFLRSPLATEDEAPDIQLTVFPRQLEPHVTRTQNQVDIAFLRSHVMLITVALIRPEARYRVAPSQSSEPLVQPNAGPDDISAYRLPSIELPKGTTEYLTPLDVQRLSWAMEQVRRILHTSPLANVTYDEVYPGSRIKGSLLEEHIRSKNLPNSHWVGSTKMGGHDDNDAVVDERLRVRGVSGLRVLDAGVIPIAPNGNTHSTVCVVARRGVELLAQDRL